MRKYLMLGIIIMTSVHGMTPYNQSIVPYQETAHYDSLFTRAEQTQVATSSQQYSSQNNTSSPGINRSLVSLFASEDHKHYVITLPHISLPHPTPKRCYRNAWQTRCPTCSQQFQTGGKKHNALKNLQNHYNSIHFARIIRICACGKHFYNRCKHSMSEHLRKNHYKHSELDSAISLEDGIFTFTWNNMTRYVCSTCGKTDDNKNRLQHHRVQECQEPNNPTPCYYTENNKLPLIITPHTNSLNICIPHVFSPDNSTLDNAIARHGNTWLSQCWKCNIIYKANNREFTKNALRRHYDIKHGIQEIFACPTCKHYSFYRHAIDSHVKTKHSETETTYQPVTQRYPRFYKISFPKTPFTPLTSITQQNGYHIGQCLYKNCHFFAAATHDKQADIAQALHDHHNHNHETAYMYICRCSNIFYSKQELDRHIGSVPSPAYTYTSDMSHIIEQTNEDTISESDEISSDSETSTETISSSSSDNDTHYTTSLATLAAHKLGQSFEVPEYEISDETMAIDSSDAHEHDSTHTLLHQLCDMDNDDIIQ